LFKLFNTLYSYYQILGITEYATLPEIKTAYKRLAKTYHPDLNPGAEAEEEFKKISLAYQVLSNPAKRSAYDSKLAQARLQQARLYQQQQARRQRASYDQPYRANSRYNYQPSKKYYDSQTEQKATVYAVAIVAAIALVVYVSTSLYDYYQAYTQEKLIESFDKQAAHADSLFYAGKDKAALLFLSSMRADVQTKRLLSSYEYEYLRFRRTQAEIDYKNGAYKDASWGFLFYMEYTNRQEKDMLYKLALCYKNLDQPHQAVIILDKLLNSDYRRFNTLALIADIYKKNIKDTAIALTYYEMGLSNIEQVFKSNYGKAYRLLVSAERTPEVYKHIYLEAAKIYYNKAAYKKARKLLEWVVFLSPENKQGYEYLYKCYISLDKVKQACSVIKKAERKHVMLAIKSVCDA